MVAGVVRCLVSGGSKAGEVTMTNLGQHLAGRLRGLTFQGLLCAGICMGQAAVAEEPTCPCFTVDQVWEQCRGDFGNPGV